MSPDFAKNGRAPRTLAVDPSPDGGWSDITEGVPSVEPSCAVSFNPCRADLRIPGSNANSTTPIAATADVINDDLYHRVARAPRPVERALTYPLSYSDRCNHWKDHALRLNQAEVVSYQLERWLSERPEDGPITGFLTNDGTTHWVGDEAALSDIAKACQHEMTDQDIGVSLAGSWMTNMEGPPAAPLENTIDLTRVIEGTRESGDIAPRSGEKVQRNVEKKG